jgi:hypothetical protein
MRPDTITLAIEGRGVDVRGELGITAHNLSVGFWRIMVSQFRVGQLREVGADFRPLLALRNKLGNYILNSLTLMKSFVRVSNRNRVLFGQTMDRVFHVALIPQEATITRYPVMSSTAVVMLQVATQIVE